MDAWNSTGLSWSEVLSIDLETFSKGNVSFISGNVSSSLLILDFLSQGLDFVLNSCRSSPVNTSEFKTNLQKSVEKLILDRKPCEDITTFVQVSHSSCHSPSSSSRDDYDVLSSSTDNDATASSSNAPPSLESSDQSLSVADSSLLQSSALQSESSTDILTS